MPTTKLKNTLVIIGSHDPLLDELADDQRILFDMDPDLFRASAETLAPYFYSMAYTAADTETPESGHGEGCGDPEPAGHVRQLPIQFREGFHSLFVFLHGVFQGQLSALNPGNQFLDRL